MKQKFLTIRAHECDKKCNDEIQIVDNDFSGNGLKRTYYLVKIFIKYVLYLGDTYIFLPQHPPPII